MVTRLVKATSSQVPAADDFVNHMMEAWDAAKKAMKEAQERQRVQANKHRRDVDFEVGQRVLLSSKKIKLKVVPLLYWSIPYYRAFWACGL